VKNCANPVLQGTVLISLQASDNCGLTGQPVITLANGGNSASATFVNESPSGTFNYAWNITASVANGTWTATASASDGVNSTSATFTLCVHKLQISGSVQLQAFTGTATVPLHTRTITFVATTGATVLKTWVLPLSNASGDSFDFTLTDVPEGTTGLSAKTAWSLRRKLAVPFDADGQAVVNFTGASLLKGGDLTGDNLVNLADYAKLVSKWLVPLSPVADINGDGAVNVIDYSVLASNWFKAGDPQ
jgi:hypothetical protein